MILCKISWTLLLWTVLVSASWLNSLGPPLQAVIDHPTGQEALSTSAQTLAEHDTNLKADSNTGQEVSYETMLQTLRVMQSHFFEIRYGTWPDAIDWTAAVMGTQVSATLATIDDYPASDLNNCDHADAGQCENDINRYMAQIAAFYFGENSFALRTQAYDDMLWVVLGWLESIRFIQSYSSRHYEPGTFPNSSDYKDIIREGWYARQFVPQFAHRARLFYDLAARGWDTKLCGGGMIWSPYLKPYKNAITNQLYITASIGMYLYFPGDTDPSPFTPVEVAHSAESAQAHGQRYLNNAIEAYDWLKHSRMLNDQGLYTDGFHVRGWRGGSDPSNGTGNCDVREGHVYSYNQGVVLSGLRGLWEATGHVSYLEDGHELIRNVIAATGYGKGDRWGWSGLGRNGVLEETCDARGSCSQDGQTFKGIFFHHFSIFCTPLPLRDRSDFGDQLWLQDDDTHVLHRQSCLGYEAWVQRNAQAALITRDENNEIGQWWGHSATTTNKTLDTEASHELEVYLKSKDDLDYRNDGMPLTEDWYLERPDGSLNEGSLKLNEGRHDRMRSKKRPMSDSQDMNDRGRGRTVETQSGGLAVVRAAYRLMQERQND